MVKKSQARDEQNYVVEPLISWFKKQKIWDLRTHKPNTAATGWDLEARRKNLDLLIEAKYVKRSFIGSFSQLISSPLTKRSQHFMKTKNKSWCAHACWAIGSSYQTRNIYQLLFDYFIRNLDFWRHYQEDLNLKYVYFVREGKVARVLFIKLLDFAEVYNSKAAGKRVSERRLIAEELMKKCTYR